jgi:NADP-dependent 3-hydroxy acid dehydrogenase YdfG
MEPQTPKIVTSTVVTPNFELPSVLWCQWQALKGTNFRHLTLPPVDMSHKLVVLTGGNSGIGREAALQFSRWGANVILGCREPPPHEMHPSLVVEECKAAALAAGHDKSWVKWWVVDMAELKTVEAFAKRLLDFGQPIDVLANNAGLAGSSAERVLTTDGFELVHQVRCEICKSISHLRA